MAVPVRIGACFLVLTVIVLAPERISPLLLVVGLWDGGWRGDSWAEFRILGRQKEELPQKRKDLEYSLKRVVAQMLVLLKLFWCETGFDESLSPYMTPGIF